MKHRNSLCEAFMRRAWWLRFKDKLVEKSHEGHDIRDCQPVKMLDLSLEKRGNC